MAKTGIELLPKAPPTGWEKLFSFWVRRIGLPLLLSLQIFFLLLFAAWAKLELDLKSLDTSTRQKEETLAKEADFEKTFRDAQAKLNEVAEVKQDLCDSCAIAVLYRLKTPAVQINYLSLEGETMTVSAKTSEATAFVLLIDKILKEEAITQAAVTNGVVNSDGQFSFSMELTFNKGKING